MFKARLTRLDWLYTSYPVYFITTCTHARPGLPTPCSGTGTRPRIGGDALPVGNGRLGGMVFGGIVKERIQLNEDTIWNGKKRDRVNPEALKALPEVRQLLFEGKVKEAEAVARPT